MSEILDILILGSGPAGWTAAIYAARANFKPLVLTGEQEGGQLTTTTEVENFPGFPTGIMGPQLMEDLRKQAERFGTTVVYKTGIKVDLSSRPFKVYTATGEPYLAKALIIATGASAKYLILPNEKKLIGHGVSTCATCDGFFFRGKNVAIVGGGDSACEEANFLTRHASKVTLIHRRDKMRASPIMQERILKNPKVEFKWDTVVDELLEKDNKLSGLALRNLKTGAKEYFSCDGLFLAIGHNPNSKLFENQLDMDENGFINTTRGMQTTIPGVFVCGDVHDHVYKQAVTAAGMGCMAALDAQRFLESDS